MRSFQGSYQRFKLTSQLLALVVCLSLWANLAHSADSPVNELANSPEELLKDSESSYAPNDPLARSFGANGSVQQDNQIAFDGGVRIRRRELGRSDSNTSHLDIVDLSGGSGGSPKLNRAPNFTSRIGDRHASLTPRNNIVFYTLDPDLQEFVSRTVNNANANHIAVVALNPKTGAILAIAGRSPTIPSIEYHAGFPAASLFKVVTAAAAVEEVGIAPDSLIPFRGGTYTLNEWNYLPNPKADRRIMSVGEALGRSCNPVFGHIGIKYLNGSILSRYAQRFGFNRSLGLDVPLPTSAAQIPSNDLFELSRTSAGFGAVTISPVHAAALVGGVANGGLLNRPYLIDRIADSDGVTLNKTQPETIQRIVQPETARSLMEMMRYTTTIGTSRREFMRGGRPALGDIEVAGKTGTLKGSNPPGLNNWFIGAAPLNNPELAVAVITVDATHSSKASRLGRLVMQRYFNIEPGPELPEPRANLTKSKHKRLVKSSKYRSKALKASKNKPKNKTKMKPSPANKKKAKKKVV